jgi:hypothetical protein
VGLKRRWEVNIKVNYTGMVHRDRKWSELAENIKFYILTVVNIKVMVLGCDTV